MSQFGSKPKFGFINVYWDGDSKTQKQISLKTLIDTQYPINLIGLIELIYSNIKINEHIVCRYSISFKSVN